MKPGSIIALATMTCVVACGKQPADENTAPGDAAGEPPAAATPIVDGLVPEAAVFDRAFVDHMHLHADRMDEIMYALSDGDLAAAATPANWLAQHPLDENIPDDWLPHVESMRKAAREVATATDIETASLAAERISIHCQRCHAAAGVDSID